MDFMLKLSQESVHNVGARAREVLSYIVTYKLLKERLGHRLMLWLDTIVPDEES